MFSYHRCCWCSSWGNFTANLTIFIVMVALCFNIFSKLLYLCFSCNRLYLSCQDYRISFSTLLLYPSYTIRFSSPFSLNHIIEEPIHSWNSISHFATDTCLLILWLRHTFSFDGWETTSHFTAETYLLIEDTFLLWLRHTFPLLRHAFSFFGLGHTFLFCGWDVPTQFAVKTYLFILRLRDTFSFHSWDIHSHCLIWDAFSFDNLETLSSTLLRCTFPFCIWGTHYHLVAERHILILLLRHAFSFCGWDTFSLDDWDTFLVNAEVHSHLVAKRHLWIMTFDLKCKSLDKVLVYQESVIFMK